MRLLPKFVLVSIPLLISCSNATKPVTIRDRILKGEAFWFVSSDHFHVQTEFKADNYAFVTILGTLWGDSVTFISAVGDTEEVALYPVNPLPGLAYLPEALPYGAAIFLSRVVGASPHDGMFGVGGQSGIPETGVIIEALGTPYGAQGLECVSALVLP
jgi:hypothetical protein